MNRILVAAFKLFPCLCSYFTSIERDCADMTVTEYFKHHEADERHGPMELGGKHVLHRLIQTLKFTCLTISRYFRTSLSCTAWLSRQTAKLQTRFC